MIAIETLDTALDWLQDHGWHTDHIVTHDGIAEPSRRIDLRDADGNVRVYQWCRSDEAVIAFAQERQRAILNDAAPDLYAALREAVGLLGEYFGETEGSPAAGVLDRAVAALEKAEATE